MNTDKMFANISSSVFQWNRILKVINSSHRIYIMKNLSWVVAHSTTFQDLLINGPAWKEAIPRRCAEDKPLHSSSHAKSALDNIFRLC